MSDSTKHRPFPRALRVVCICAGVLAGIICILLVALTLYLTPANLTQILNREASGYFNADVRVSNARFTIWSTFPHLFLEIDSLRIVSRNLQGISPEIKNQLPADADFLASTGKLKGSINVIKLISGGIWMKELAVDGLKLNLVAYNDSVNNYDIIPREEIKGFSVPYFTAGSVILRNTQPIRFFSAATQTDAEARISDARLVRDAKRHDRYRLLLGGRIDTEVRGISVLSRFPFNLQGNVDLRFHPFRVGFNRFDVDLGNTRGRLDMSMNLGESIRVNNLSYRIQAFDLTRFLRFLPGLDSGIIKGLNADLSVEASARLTEPFIPSATRLPSFEIVFRVPEGQLFYTLSGGKSYSLTHSAASGKFVFDGRSVGRSNIILNPVDIMSEGLKTRISVRIDSLLANPRAITRISLDADLKRLSGLPPFQCYGMSGNMHADATIRFCLENISAPAIDDVIIDGTVRIGSFAMQCDTPETRLHAENVRIAYSGKADRLSREILLGSSVSVLADAGRVDLISGDNTFQTRGLHLVAGSRCAELTSSDKFLRLPYTTAMTLKSMRLDVPSDTLSFECGDVSLSGVASTIDGFSRGSSASANVEVAAMGIRTPDIKLNTSGFSGCVSMTRFAAGALAPISSDAVSKYSDTLLLSKINHTAEKIVMQLPPDARQFINSFGLSTGIHIDRGSLSTPRYPDAVEFSGLDVAATPDSIMLGPLSVRAGTTSARLSASAGNLRRAFTFAQPVRIPVRMNLELDTVNINYLARFYEDSHPYADEIKTLSPDDSLTLIVPRNLDLQVRASAKQTVYTDLHLYDLSTLLTMSEGVARVNDLRISSDFGHAYMDLGYDSSDVGNISMDASAGVLQIDVVTFFQRFHSLLMMMPQIKNLSGWVSAEVKGGLEIFPDMDINLPSVNAELAVQGRELRVRQNKFIRRITRMMLIPDSHDLQIRNMNVRASIHDNLIELYPFDFEFSRYRLRMLGLNNFNGRLYYHIGVEENPLHLPFGINIEGSYSDPKLSFGGATYKEKHGFDVTSRVMVEKRMNLVGMARKFIKEFLHKAAQSSDN